MHLLLPLVALGLTDLLAFPSQAKIAALAAQATGKKAVNKASDVSLVKLLLAFLPSSSQTDPQATTSVRLVRYYCAPIFIFLALYSFLPHKVIIRYIYSHKQAKVVQLILLFYSYRNYVSYSQRYQCSL